MEHQHQTGKDQIVSDDLLVPEHLTALLERGCQALTLAEQGKLAALLRRFSGVFSTGDGDIGRTDLSQHHIDTGEASPVR